MKIEAIVGPNPPVSATDTLVVWREAQLYPTWFPMMTGGKKLAEFSPAEVVIQLEAELSFMFADLLLHGWGARGPLRRSSAHAVCGPDLESHAACDGPHWTPCTTGTTPR